MNNPWIIAIASGLIVEIIVALFKKSRSWTIIGIIALVIAMVFLFSNNTTPPDNQSQTPPPITIITTPTPSTSSTVSTSQPTTSIPIIPGGNVSAIIQYSSNLLTENKTIITPENALQNFTTKFTLTGFITLIIENPTINDETFLVIIDFQIPKIPSITSNIVSLEGNIISWTCTTANSYELAFQTTGWGLTMHTGEKMVLHLKLLISISQPTPLENNPWQQSYPFTVSASIK